MKRTLGRVLAVTSAVAGIIGATGGVAFAADHVTDWDYTVGTHTTTGRILAGSGTMNLRALQYCETPSGQTNWYAYGATVHKINVWSTTSSCQIVLWGGIDHN